jgi:hypothetical protein
LSTQVPSARAFTVYQNGLLEAVKKVSSVGLRGDEDKKWEKRKSHIRVV